MPRGVSISDADDEKYSSMEVGFIVFGNGSSIFCISIFFFVLHMFFEFFGTAFSKCICRQSPLNSVSQNQIFCKYSGGKMYI